ncbi:MAG: hypothetical protein K0S76_171 [Herbinix sp.]|jgi:hypothetical protein|nr:hypothetical protein [Herbinix sp.]
MTYQTADSMILTRNCLSLTASDAVTPLGFLKSKITYSNGCSSLIDLATGIVTPVSAYYKQRKHNKRHDDPDEYVYTPVYFEDPDPEVTESLYRQGRVHIINSILSDFHRNLFEDALRRAAIQYDCDITKAVIDVHHLNRNRQDNSIVNLIPVTRKEHRRIHSALYRGAGTYGALVYALGEELVNSIFDEAYFNYGDRSVFTSAINGIPYTQLMLTQLSEAQLPVDTKLLWIRCLNGKYDSVNIEGLNVYQILSALYLKSAIKIMIL